MVYPSKEEYERVGTEKYAQIKEFGTGTVETTLLRKDGIIIDALMSSAPIDPNNLAAGVTFTTLDITERKQTELEREQLLQTAEESQARLQALTTQLVKVQEEERRHLARELHDEIGQRLTAISQKIDGIDGIEADSPSGRDLTQAMEMIDHMLQIVRGLSLDLRPTMLDELGLVPTLRWFLKRQQEMGRFEISLDDSGIEARPPALIETVCYRIVQEALTNISRYADATEVEIVLSAQHNELQVEIRDNGKGFDVDRAIEEATHGKSTGLLGMQERAAQIGGTVEITSKISQGTIIHGYLPY